MKEGLQQDISGKRTLWQKIVLGIKIFVAVFATLFVAAVIWRMPIVAEQDHQRELDHKYARALIGMLDVDGSRVPPKPDERIAKASVLGIDTNKNAIRDDIEVMIYEMLPVVSTTSDEGIAAYGDANFRLRAAELQYAKAAELPLREVTDTDSYVLAIKRIHASKMCVVYVALRAYDTETALEVTKKATEEIASRIFDTQDRLTALGELAPFVVPVATSTQDRRCDIGYPG